MLLWLLLACSNCHLVAAAVVAAAPAVTAAAAVGSTVTATGAVGAAARLLLHILLLLLLLLLKHHQLHCVKLYYGGERIPLLSPEQSLGYFLQRHQCITKAQHLHKIVS